MYGLHDVHKGLESLATCRRVFGMAVVGFLCLFVFCLIMLNSGDRFQALSLFGTSEKCRDNLSFTSPLKLRRKHWLSLYSLRKKKTVVLLLGTFAPQVNFI